MKTRNFFISNSSSSSFICLLEDDFNVKNFVTSQLTIFENQWGWYCENIFNYYSEVMNKEPPEDDSFNESLLVEVLENIFKTIYPRKEKVVYENDNSITFWVLYDLLGKDSRILYKFRCDSDDGYFKFISESDIKNMFQTIRN